MSNLFTAVPQLAYALTPVYSETHPELGEVGFESISIPSGVPLYDFLTLASGIFWTITYILLIYRGFRDKTCGMPLFVLGLNFSWEFIFGILGPPFLPEDSFLGVSVAHTWSQRFDDILWFIFDCVLLYLKFKYGKDEFKAQYPHAPTRFFPIYVTLQVVVSFAAVFFAVYEWHDPNGIYSAYMQNFFISLLFITQLWRHGNTRGVNMGVAICKMLGTIAPSTLGGIAMIAYWGIPLKDAITNASWLPFLHMLILCCTVMDIAYCFMLYWAIKKEGRNPFSLAKREPVTEDVAFF